MATLLVLGGGSWGTALAALLASRGQAVALWEYDAARREELRRTRGHRALGALRLPDTVTLLDGPAAGAAGVVVAVPSHTVRATAALFAAAIAAAPWTVSAAKGIEENTFCRMSEAIVQGAGADPARVGALTGPSHAEEVAADLPTSVVAAFPALALARSVQETFSTPRFRVYAADDLPGAELGGALKNVMAIASGIADGLGCGDNARAALMTRGLREMVRLGTALGARAETFAGLSGMGDLIVTCTSRHSRNRRLGELLGRGVPLADAAAELGMVAEGVRTCAAVHALAQARGLALPVTAEVHGILYDGQPPRAAVENLMRRTLADE